MSGQKCYSAFSIDLQISALHVRVENIRHADFMEVSPGSEDNIDLPLAVDLSTDNSAYLLGRKPTKRLRLYSWQRRKKYKKVSDFEDVPV